MIQIKRITIAKEQMTRAKEIVAKYNHSFSMFNIYMKKMSDLQIDIYSEAGITRNRIAPGVESIEIAPWKKLAANEQLFSFREAKELAKQINVAVSPEDEKALHSSAVFMMLTLRLKAAKGMQDAADIVGNTRSFAKTLAEEKL